MTRDDYLEIAVRVLGPYAWLQAGFAAVNGVATLPLVVGGIAWPSGPHPQLTPLSGLLGGILCSTVKCVLLFLIGRYLIADGRRVLRQIRRVAGARSRDPAA
jgi:hypothetical protein